MRPPGPEPGTWLMSTPISRASCRTDGAAGAAARRVAGGASAGWSVGLGDMAGDTGVVWAGAAVGTGRTRSVATPFSATSAGAGCATAGETGAGDVAVVCATS